MHLLPGSKKECMPTTYQHKTEQLAVIDTGNKMHHCKDELRSPPDLTQKLFLASDRWLAETMKYSSPNDLLKKLNLTDEFLEMLAENSTSEEVTSNAISDKAEQRRRRKSGKKPRRTSESIGETKRKRKPKEDRRLSIPTMGSSPSRSQSIMDKIRDEALHELGEPMPLAELACMFLRVLPASDPGNEAATSKPTNECT
jgi:hypothetical protein